MEYKDDLSRLQALETTVATAFKKKDIGTLMSVYAPGESLVVFDVVGPPGVHCGWDAYREAFKQMFAAIDGPLRFTMSDLNIEISEDIAYSSSRQRVSGVHARDGKLFDYTVRVTDVYRKVRGEWLIVHEHLSLPMDRDTFMPMLQS